MLFVLTTSKGHTFKFTILSCAQLYQGAYGGTLVTEWIEDDSKVELVN
jgi:hypothetical protein